MGYSKDLGTGIVAGISQKYGYPVDRFGHLLNPLDTYNGTPPPDWQKKGVELANMTNPYGFLHFAVGSADDFWCFDYRTFNAGPLGEHMILDATLNSESGGFIEGMDYMVLPVRSLAEGRAAIEYAYGLIDTAIEWCNMGDDATKHDRRGWNQDEFYFARAVANRLFGWRFDRIRATERQLRFGGKRVDRLIEEIRSEVDK